MLAAALCVPAAAAEPHPLRTAIVDPAAFTGPEAELAFKRVKASGATFVKLALFWGVLAPSRPSGDRTDPANRAYHWESLDRQISRAHAAGLEPIVYITGSPRWARDMRAGGRRTTWPKPSELALFARAAAKRYDGEFVSPAGRSAGRALPRVRAWQVWNEPNARRELSPQFRGGRPVSPEHYRRMVNAFADAVHAVHCDNLVVAGGLGPFGHRSRDIEVVAPLRFMRLMLRARSHFDVWATHPYTNGGPTHHAAARDDVSLGDLPRMERVLRAAVRSGNVVSSRPVEFWVTEFGWDTNRPDPRGVPMKLHARWVAEALYRMWSAGVSLVTWFRVGDDPLRSSPYQSGLYFSGGEPKFSLRAFRFPFVAFRRKGGPVVWGRTPRSGPDPVVVEQKNGSRWSALAALKPDRYGIFSARLRSPLHGPLRARLANGAYTSVPFSLSRPPDRRVFPFGCGGPIRC